MKMTGGDALAQQLVREGVTEVFGVPGVQLDYAIDGLAKFGDPITYRMTRHEQAASYMADGYARTTGRVGVCMVVPGPGLLNAMSGLATAYACSSPVVCIAGQIPSPTIGRGLGVLHEIQNQSRVLDAVTKWHALARAPQSVPWIVRKAFATVASGRPGPVAVEIPPDVLEHADDIRPLTPPGPPEPKAISRVRLDRAADLLRRAARPVIYAGWGVQAADATAELLALAERLQAPVVMSEHGRGAISDRHPLALTALGGRPILPRADVVLAVGTRFVDGQGAAVVTRAGTHIILLNADARHLGRPRRATVVLEGDARHGLAELGDRLTQLGSRSSPSEALNRVRAWSGEQIAAIEPQWSWVKALRAAIPEDGILVSELTQVGYHAQVAYPVYGPRTFLTPGYQGTLGYGFPTALGAAVGNPGRAIVSIAGDGGFGWNLQELATARKYNLGLVTVVFNDGAYGNVRRGQKNRFGGRFLGTDLCNPDFVSLAAAFGVDATRVDAPDALEGALREAIRAGRPAVIDVPVGEMPSAWHLLHEFLPAPRPAPPTPILEDW